MAVRRAFIRARGDKINPKSGGKMTWGEFKRKVEEEGLKDEDEILWIVWPSGSLEKNGEIHCYRNEFGWEIVVKNDA